MVRFYYFSGMHGMGRNVEVKIEGYSDDSGEVVIEARSVNGGVAITGCLEDFTVTRPGKFSRPLGYGDLHHFRCLEAA